MRSIIAIWIMVVGLSACGGGGGGNSGSGIAPERPSGQVSGKAVDAVLVNSTIRAYEWNGSNSGAEFIAETTTDHNGDYTLTPSHGDSYLLLKATGGHYVEEATGVSVEMKSGQELTTLVRYESGTAITSHITVLTHWAVCQAEWRVKSQASNISDAVGLSNDVFSAMAGVAIREVAPLNITDPNNASPVLTAGLQYGIIPAAISSLTKEMAESSGLPPHTLSSTTSIHFAQIGCNDIRADGKLDGQGYANDDSHITSLAFGTVPLSARIYRTEVAQHILKMASSELNKTGLEVSEFLNRAQSLSTMDAGIFANLEPESVDLEGPIISNNLPENTHLTGSVDIDFTIDDPLGIKKVEYYVDGLFVGLGSLNNTTFSFDTRGYADGEYEIKVLAYDTLGNEGSFVRNYNFDNSGPVVTVTSPTLTNNMSYDATGTYDVEGAAIKSIMVNGEAAAIDLENKTWSATVLLEAGNNDLVVQAEDETNNLGPEIVVNVAVDSVRPTVTNSGTNAYFSTGQNQFNLCTPGPIQPNNPNAICIRDDRVSLNGELLSENLLSYFYVLVGYQVSDAPVDGVFTPKDDLLVEYKVEKDNELFQDWREAPLRSQFSSNWYLPITTEYLGDDWYQTSIDSVFVLTLKVADQAGNWSSYAFSMQFDVLPSTVSMITSFPDESLLAGATFATRTAVDGQDFEIVYSYLNDSSVGYYIYLGDDADHTVEHSYETLVRKNKTRIVNQEQWQVRFMANEWNAFSGDGTGGAGSWENVSSLQRFNRSNDQWQTVTPTSSNGAYQFWNTDNPSVTTTEWQDQPRSPYCGADWMNYGPRSWSLVRAGDNANSFTGSKVACLVNTLSTQPNGSAYYFKHRYVESVQYASGYPRNESSITNNPAIDLPTNSLQVFNDTLAQEILPTGGWYLVPAATEVRIVKTVRLPALTHRTDSEVANSGTFSSYSAKSLDKSTTWKIDSDISVTRVIASAGLGDINSQSQVTQVFGDGIKQYTVSR